MDEKATPVDPDVWWEPIRFSADEIATIEAELPNGDRLRPVHLLGGRRLGFERRLPIGTRIHFKGAVAWIVKFEDGRDEHAPGA